MLTLSSVLSKVRVVDGKEMYLSQRLELAETYMIDISLRGLKNKYSWQLEQGSMSLGTTRSHFCSMGQHERRKLSERIITALDCSSGSSQHNQHSRLSGPARHSW